MDEGERGIGGMAPGLSEALLERWEENNWRTGGRRWLTLGRLDFVTLSVRKTYSDDSLLAYGTRVFRKGCQRRFTSSTIDYGCNKVL